MLLFSVSHMHMYVCCVSFVAITRAHINTNAGREKSPLIHFLSSNTESTVTNRNMSVPNVKLNNGKTIPILGLGTWNVSICAELYDRCWK